MKRIFILALVITLLIFSSVSVGAEEIKKPEFQDLLLTEEEFVYPNSKTGKYAPDFSSLETEIAHLRKEVRDLYSLGKNSANIRRSELDSKEIYSRISNLVESIKEQTNTNSKNNTKVSVLAYDDFFNEHESEIIEAQLHFVKDHLSNREIATALSNSFAARDHAIRYAENRNYYSGGTLKTWDNPADTLRHFAWNYMNSNDFGINKARSAGDIHELALIGAEYAANQNCSGGCALERGTRRALEVEAASKNRLSSFNSYFDNSSVMDLINNSKGRLAYQSNDYSQYSSAFNSYLQSGLLISFPTSINNSRRNTAWNGFR